MPSPGPDESMMESLTFAPDSAAMARSDISFLIIGAQKAGTTSLVRVHASPPRGAFAAREGSAVLRRR